MERFNAWGKNFVPHISKETIERSIKGCAAAMNERYRDATDETAPIFVSILNGAFVFTADLLRETTFPSVLSFIKLSSYEGSASLGKVTEVIGLNMDIAGRDIIIIDDIIDSGLTMMGLKRQLLEMNPKSIAVATFIHKKHSCDKSLMVDFAAIETTEDSFVIGYGLDYDGIGRNLPSVYILEE